MTGERHFARIGHSRAAGVELGMAASVAEILVEDAVEFTLLLVHGCDLPPDLADCLLHVWLDKRGWLGIDDPFREPDSDDPLDILERQLTERRDRDLGRLPAYHAVVLKVQGLRALYAAGLPRFADQLTDDEWDLVIEYFHWYEDDEIPRILLMRCHKPMEMLARGRFRVQDRAAPALRAIDSLRRKLDAILGARAVALQEFSDGLSLLELAVVHQALWG